MQELPLEDQVSLLRHHSMNLAGYAFALARRQGMEPEEAVRLWREPAMQRPAGEEVETQTWLERNAAAMAMFHGPVNLDRAGGAWTMRVTLGEQLAPLAAWESVDYWVRWIVEESRIAAQPRGLTASGRLDGETLVLHFEPLGHAEMD